MLENISTNRGLCIITFNVAKNFGHMDTVLQTCKNRYDIMFFEEPSWRVIRKAPSTHNREGNDVVGAPSHLDWITIVRATGVEDKVCPLIMAYVSTRLKPWRPSYRRDLIDHCNVLPLSLFIEERTVNIMGVYSDDAHTTIRLLSQKADSLPSFEYIGGNFNCHSKEWDPAVPHHRMAAISLLDTAATLGTELGIFSNPGPTFIPHN